MAVIVPGNYKNIADFYASAQTVAAGAISYYYEAAEEILLLDDFDPEVDLLVPFYNAYLTSTNIYVSAPLSAVTAVATLQRHILSKATQSDGTRYTSISSWITDNGFKVEPEFAAMSTSAGYALTTAAVKQ